MNDTITAIATPFGSGGIGVIRISGPESFDLAAQIFSRSNKTPVGFSDFETHRVYHGFIFDPDTKEIFDEILLIPMQAPRSYTAEDVVEIQAHSGTMVLKSILDLLISSGARLAEPGEFTRRAFLNQRIDLTQAEAVADIINARSANALKFATSQNMGTLREKIQGLTEKLVHLLSLLEANIDFPDDVSAFNASQADYEMLDTVIEQCQEFIKRHDDACFLKEGIRLTICGAPNVGKSSLMNRLLAQERSIVTSVPGTTRDPIEEGLNMEGIPFVITDTAGIHQTDDLVEIIGIEKAKDHIQASDIVLFLKEPDSRLTQNEFEKVVPLGKKVIFIINKIDLDYKTLPILPEGYQDVPTIQISALLDRGIRELKQTIVRMVLAQIDTGSSPVIPNLRHKKALEETVTSLETVKKGLENRQEEELLAMDIKNSIDSLGTITGESASLDILDNIFNNFCIGK